MYFLLALVIAQATPYPGGGFVFSGGRCWETVQTGPVHWGLDREECQSLARLDRHLNRVYQARLKSAASGRLALRDAQRSWLRALNAKCGLGDEGRVIDGDTAGCFTAEVRARIAALRG